MYLCVGEDDGFAIFNEKETRSLVQIASLNIIGTRGAKHLHLSKRAEKYPKLYTNYFLRTIFSDLFQHVIAVMF